MRSVQQYPFILINRRDFKRRKRSAVNGHRAVISKPVKSERSVDLRHCVWCFVGNPTANAMRTHDFDLFATPRSGHTANSFAKVTAI
jgi:hypothetical protein